ncbi:MAG: DNA helicase II [Candidatus Endonucleobacter sp. (ex Gigantidas childressi)]|nr:DNA helicase II [Candidatus Endonucleobacter sp. (ex Gigantidas childressi)]
MDVTSVLDPLNEAQRKAVAAPLSSILVLAGAGSGKTRVLVHRIAWLVQANGLSPYSILAVTFTNKAAAEMRSRIESLLGMPPKGMWVGTFHGLSHRMLRTHYKEVGLPENFQILDSDDQLRIIKRIIRNMQLDEKQWPPRQAQWYINNKKDEGLRPSHIDPGYNAFDKNMLLVYHAYHDYCEQVGVVDFGELLLRTHELMRNNPSILQHYQNRFRYILVDEFQDTNAVQYAWLRLLAGEEDKMMVVGDDDQSIYGWRGAKIEHIRQFSDDFSNATTIKLEQNYRSTGSILKAANAVISNNRDRLGKELWTNDDDGEVIKLYAGFNEVDEARFITDRIREAVQHDMSRSDIAVLYRSNAQSRILEEAMLRSSIPYRIYGGQRFFERAEIKNALAYMRLASNPNDDTAIERVINIPPRGIGGKTVERLREIARNQGTSLWEALNTLVNPSQVGNKINKGVVAFVELAQRLSHSDSELKLGELADNILTITGLVEYHAKEKGEKGRARVENLEELVTACQQFNQEDVEFGDNSDPMTPLDAFLAHATLESGDNQADKFTDSVQMMTLHSAKGLEFSLVFLVGLEEGLFPHKMSLSEGNIDEERRLCYVGITRAMRQLYITYAETRRLYGVETRNRPSRFIKEIPSELLQEVRLGGKITQPVSAKSQLSAAPDGLSLGQRVHHDVFGEGAVINYEGEGAQVRIQISFDTEGSKWLMMEYASLQAI